MPFNHEDAPRRPVFFASKKGSSRETQVDQIVVSFVLFLNWIHKFMDEHHDPQEFDDFVLIYIFLLSLETSVYSPESLTASKSAPEKPPESFLLVRLFRKAHWHQAILRKGKKGLWTVFKDIFHLFCFFQAIYLYIYIYGTNTVFVDYPFVHLTIIFPWMYLYFIVPLWFWNGRSGGHVWERDWVEKTSQIPASNNRLVDERSLKKSPGFLFLSTSPRWSHFQGAINWWFWWNFLRCCKWKKPTVVCFRFGILLFGKIPEPFVCSKKQTFLDPHINSHLLRIKHTQCIYTFFSINVLGYFWTLISKNRGTSRMDGL